MLDDATDGRTGMEASARRYGKYAGLVADNAAPASGPHRGEVVVSVPGILEETPDGTGSQPLTVTAAPAFLPGFFFVPEAGDTVWVEFVDGDIDHPIWTGVWYPPDKVPQTVEPGAPTLDQKVIRTRSGHVIQLDDTGGSEQLVIRDGTHKATLTFDKAGITVTSGTALALGYQPEGGTAATLTLDGNGIVLTCGQSSLTLTDGQIVLSRPAVTLTVAGTVDVS